MGPAAGAGLHLPASLRAPGGVLWAHARRQWLALTVLAATGFALVVIPAASNWLVVHGTLGRWLMILSVAILLGLATIAVINWRVHREHGREHGREAPAGLDALEEID
ncbi:MAG TPA: hypothetical protein VGC45_02550 [Gryllotalpicola sp.]